jgi:uncharacterized protein
MMHYLLTYDYVADILERRGEFRAAHLKAAWDAHERGELLLAGALAEPVDGAVFVFQCEDESKITAFVEQDPYVRAGLVTQWRIRKWPTSIGALATNPVRP